MGKVKLRVPHAFDLDPEDRDEMLYGASRLFTIFDSHRELARKTWLGERDGVLRWWVKKHPGTRPYYWWAFDVDCPREPRRVFAGPPPFAVRDWIRGTRWGRGIGVRPEDCESQRDFLERHGLLTAQEKTLLARGGEFLDPEKYFEWCDWAEVNESES